jgi:hypothetical protein
MMAIPFTQYVLPDGRREQIEIVRPEEIEALARKVIAVGGRFECEKLRTGVVSLTCSYNDEDIAIELARDEKFMSRAVDRLVRIAFFKIQTMGNGHAKGS